MKLLNPDNSVLMEVSELRRDGSNLVIKGSIMGSMPVHAVLTPSEARSAFGLLRLRLWLFLFSMLFRS
ncbi:MAG: hypothetical protein ACT4PZ_09190 [Panacagrimonas sp.]